MDIYREDLALWEEECKLLHAGLSRDDSTQEEQVQILHPTQYAYFPIEDIKQEAVDCVRIRCGLAKNQTLGLSLGQHIIVRSSVLGPSLTRQYTPISPLDAKGYFELVIKVYMEGRMSQRVAMWKVGDKLEARGPAGHLSYVRNKFRRILMICAGTGIAPMCQIISSVLADPAEETYLRLVYGCHTYQHIVAQEEIDEWKKFWNFSCLYVLSQEPDVPSYRYKIGDDIYRGRIKKNIIHRELDGRTDGTFVLVCGTWSFDADVVSYLKELGVPETNVHRY
uniref:NADH-cytochrome b5 reductase n=1 Tax=Arion vulgaris TaxID=1028688 RepID=A0A0B7A1U7_9EUPU